VTAPEAKKKRPALFVLVGCAGCGFLLLLAGVGGTMGWLLWQQNRTTRSEPVAGWQDSLRLHYRLPALVARLASVSGDSGDAAALLPASQAPDIGNHRRRAVQHLVNAAVLSGQDSAAIRGALHDSTAALASAAARRSRFNPSTFLDSAGNPLLMPPLGPGLRLGGWRRIGPMVDMLILRGEARRWRGDLDGSRQDFAAVIALGRLVWTYESSDFGPIVGRRAIESGSAGLSRVALQAGNRAAAAAADSLREWSREPLSTFRYVGPLPPEGLLQLARDTALPRGVRASALENACWGSIYRPFWRLITGPSGELQAGVRELTHDGDPAVARAAVMAESTLSKLDAIGIRNRFRVASGRSVR